MVRAGLLIDDYALLDLGWGRRLERFGPYIIDRPAPAAAGIPDVDPASWETADARYEREGASGTAGRWERGPEMPDAWQASFAGNTVELRLTPSGQIGVFPEQEPNWRWVAERVAASARGEGGSPPAVLDLFAYTGLATLTAARAGAAVTHVDAARNLLAWARHSAALSGLAEAPIRWIAEDAPTFVAREARRGRRYDGLILDPPSYGHGTGSRTWRLERDLPDLLRECRRLTPERPSFLLLSCHTPGIGAEDLADLMGETWRLPSPPEPLELGRTAADGRRLPSGVAARWPADRTTR